VDIAVSRLSLGVLPFLPEACAPALSAVTVETHHERHHRGCLERTRELVRDSPYEVLSLADIVRRSHDDGQMDLFNHAAEAWNHALYWASLKPGGGGHPTGVLADRIDRDFGGYAALRKQWLDAARDHFGPGWTWLVMRSDGTLAIETTDNADTPLVRGDTALLAIDLWEHAYYLDWLDRRADYVTAFIEQLVDWRAAAERYVRARRRL
jgi:Fe-Mn family superoxide dismutase